MLYHRSPYRVLRAAENVILNLDAVAVRVDAAAVFLLTFCFPIWFQAVNFIRYKKVPSLRFNF